MLSSAVVHATLPASDIERAKKFYGGVLGLEMVDENETTAEYRCGNGTVLFVYPSMYAGKNEATAAEFEVGDVEATKAELERRGVRFEEYEIAGLKSDRGDHDAAERGEGCLVQGQREQHHLAHPTDRLGRSERLNRL